MKKQGHRVIGISVQWFETEEEKQVYPRWSIEDLVPIREICDFLDIEFYGVQGRESFIESIEELALSARLSGRVYREDVAFHRTLIHLLIEKAKLLRADLICTGHFAKVTKNQSTGRLNVLTASDIEQDQSYLLGALTQAELAKLELPLSEMSLAQVKKIAEVFPNPFKDLTKKRISPLLQQKNFDQYVRSRVPASLIKSGQIVQLNDEVVLGEHEGHHHLLLGADHLMTKDFEPLDPELVAIEINPYDGKVWVEEGDKIFYQTIHLAHMKLVEDADISRPSEVYALLPQSHVKYPALFCPHSNHVALIELKERLKGFLPAGSSVFLYSKAGRGGKLLGYGQVERAGFWDEEQFVIKERDRELEAEQEEMDEELREAKKAEKEAFKARGARF